MTTYAGIPNSDIDPESPVTTSLVTALRDNPVAITEGASGAPKIQTAALAALAVTEAKLAASIVSQGKLKTATVTSLAGGLTGASVDITLTAYCFFPMIHVDRDGGADGNLTGHSVDGASPDAPRFRINGVTTGNGSESYDVEYRHVAA